MTTGQIIDKLREDEHYYGEFGSKFLSNSDIKILLSNPLGLREPSKTTVPFLVGGYFHTAILEPDKIKNFKVVQASTRNTKAYKDVAGGELCLLQHEVDTIELMRDKVMANDICKDLITLGNVEYEKPMITELFGNTWKGKADIVNHEEKLKHYNKVTDIIDDYYKVRLDYYDKRKTYMIDLLEHECVILKNKWNYISKD